MRFEDAIETLERHRRNRMCVIGPALALGCCTPAQLGEIEQLNWRIECLRTMRRLHRADFSALRQLETIYPAIVTLRPELNCIRWRGESLRGKRLLVYPGTDDCTGYGDHIQLVRYIPRLANIAARVIVETKVELLDLFGTLNCDAAFIARGEQLPEFDLAVPFFFLPLECGESLSNLDGSPYLATPEAHKRKWADLVERGEKIRVGLSWSGDPNSLGNRYLKERWCSIGDLTPLLLIEGVEFYSLRKGMPPHEVAALKREPRIKHIGDEFENFSDTAGAIEHMDLVIATDGSVAHLAGALGKQVWTMLNFDSSWIFFDKRDDSPWYESMRLFRQTRKGDWRTVVERAAAELKRLVTILAREDGRPGECDARAGHRPWQGKL